jgi:hypothetical protein
MQTFVNKGGETTLLVQEQGSVPWYSRVLHLDHHLSASCRVRSATAMADTGIAQEPKVGTQMLGDYMHVVELEYLDKAQWRYAVPLHNICSKAAAVQPSSRHCANVQKHMRRPAQRPKVQGCIGVTFSEQTEAQQHTILHTHLAQ